MTVDAIGNNSPTALAAGLPPVAYEHATNPDEAHQLIRRARLQGPIGLGPHGPEVLSYGLVRKVLRHKRFRMPKGLALAAQGITSGPVWDKATAGLLSRDGADHNRLRRLVAKAFTPRSTARLKSTIVKSITELVDPVTSAGRCDVVADVAREYPIAIISGLLGAPRRDDLVSDLIRAEHDGDRLTADELVMLSEGLLMAGTDTTRNQLGAAVQTLCDHPAQWDLLAAHPELAPRAVEELMRYNPVVFGTIRQPLEDVELEGVTVPAGTHLMVNTAAANRDPAVYDDPDGLDITRDGPASMLTFGGGIHYCLGAHLARAELAEALTVITCRMPNPRRTGPAPWKPLLGITGPAALPIEFDAGH